MHSMKPLITKASTQTVSTRTRSAGGGWSLWEVAEYIFKYVFAHSEPGTERAAALEEKEAVVGTQVYSQLCQGWPRTGGLKLPLGDMWGCRDNSQKSWFLTAGEGRWKENGAFSVTPGHSGDMRESEMRCC